MKRGIKGDRRFEKLLDDLKSVRIQGAEAVAERGLEGAARLLKERKKRDLQVAIRKLLSVRQTEPMMRNTVRSLLSTSTPENAEVILKQLLTGLIEGRKTIAAYGAVLLKSGATYATHCHSSTVIGAFLKAKSQGKRFTVHNTETRPLFQGRKSARELANEKIKVVHFVDSAATLSLEGCSALLLGADALLPDGSILNKIGSGMLTELAFTRNVPVYVLASSWKLVDKIDLDRFKLKEGEKDVAKNIIEHRAPSEVWANAPSGVEVENPAFEVVPRRFITAIITEQGIADPESAVSQARTMLSWRVPDDKKH